MTHSGFMIALVPDPTDAERLLVSGGEDVSDLHLTLAYCPSEDVTQVQVAQIIAALAELAKNVPPIEAKVSGVGRFQCDPGDSEAQDVLYASVDSPKLPPFHYNVSEILYRYEVPLSTEHGFTPHITLKYLDPGVPADLQLPDGPVDIRFEYLVLRAGDDEVAIELTGHSTRTMGNAPGLYGSNPLFEAELLESAGTLELQEQQGMLLEATASAGDKSGSKWRVLLIKAGTSGNRVHYPESVLRQAAPLFEGTKAFADHPGKSDSINRPERSIRDVVGWYDKVAWSPEYRGLTADFHVLESADWLRQSLMSSWTGGNPTLLGFSINAAGTKSGKLVEGGALLEAITHVRSTDVVTTPGAGGRVLDVLESVTSMNELDELRESLEEFKADLLEGVHALLLEKWNTKGKKLSAAHRAAISASLKARGGTKKGTPAPGPYTRSKKRGVKYNVGSTAEVKANRADREQRLRRQMSVAKKVQTPDATYSKTPGRRRADFLKANDKAAKAAKRSKPAPSFNPDWD